MCFDVSVQPSLPKGRIGSHGPTPHIGDQTHQGPHLQSPVQNKSWNREIKIVQICEAMQLRRCSKLPPPAVGCPSHLLRLTDRSHRSQIAFESIVSHCSKCKNSIKMYKIVAFTSQNLLWTHQLASTCSALFLSSGKSWVYCPSAAPVPMDRAMALAHWKQRAEAAPKHQIEPWQFQPWHVFNFNWWKINEILEVLRSQSRSEQQLC